MVIVINHYKQAFNFLNFCSVTKTLHNIITFMEKYRELHKRVNEDSIQALMAMLQE